LGVRTRLSRGPVVWRRQRVCETSSGFSHSAPDFGVLPFGSGSRALLTLLEAVQALALTLRGRIFAFVRTLLSLVRRLLAIIRD
jgi:hypothetical protein